MEGRWIRETFLSFFEERGHRRVPSSSLIPDPESGLLLTNAGMNQFIPYFLGLAEPPFRRATSAQKCFRAVDIENVGHTDRHLTLFEMLGNFSFGDYFKAESCAWGLELVTERYGVDPDRLWVSVFETDDETIGIWQDLGFPVERIVRRGKADNFWWTHAAGPAGPCSEIFVDRGPAYGAEGGPEVDEDRFMEVWNHVFMQVQVDDEANVLHELPAKNIDTGASVERVAVVLQDVANVFETDFLRPLVAEVESLSGKRYGEDERTDVSIRIVAEHGRSTTFLIADGVQPSNEGRGYILRRMLRRMVSHARRIDVKGHFTDRLVGATAEMLGEAYPELRENLAFVLQVAGSEEERFSGTLRQGMELFRQARDAATDSPGATEFPPEAAFKLHDTHGFPIELTAELAADEGLEVDMERFAALMDEQRKRAKESVKKGKLDEEVAAAVTRAGGTEFVGYEGLSADARLVALLVQGVPGTPAQEGQEVAIILDRTPFYAESGGQVGDQGRIRTPSGVIRITDAQWAGGHAIVHSGLVESGEIREGDEAHAEVDAARRGATARSHTATHVVHWTLKHVLGEHARQAGSYVAPGRLRFDFPHHSAVPKEVLEEAERIANERLAEDAGVRIFETTFDEARRLGAIALFGEKYGEYVRVVEVGDYSRELCGGTHVARTGNVALVRILGEASIGAGMRRVEALVGPDALREINVERRLLEEIVQEMGASDLKGAPERARQIIRELKQLQSELGKLRKGDRDAMVEQLASSATQVGGVALVVSEIPGGSPDELRELALAVRTRLEKTGAGAVVLGTAEGGSPKLVAACTTPLVELGVTAPELLAEAAKAIGGGAGGKPIVGMAGGRKPEALPEALGGIPARLTLLLSGGA